MSVKIRLTRMGDKKNAIYRIVVADSKVSRDGIYVDQIGFYNPNVNPAEVKVDVEKANKWLANGAQPTDTAKALLSKNGVSFVKKSAKKAESKKTTKTEEKKPAAKKTTKSAK